MSAILDLGLPCPAPAVDPEPASCPLLTDEQLAAVDETMLFEDMRNTLVRAEFVARQRRFDSKFAPLL